MPNVICTSVFKLMDVHSSFLFKVYKTGNEVSAISGSTFACEIYKAWNANYGFKYLKLVEADVLCLVHKTLKYFI